MSNLSNFRRLRSWWSFKYVTRTCTQGYEAENDRGAGSPFIATTANRMEIKTSSLESYFRLANEAEDTKKAVK